MFSLFIWRSIWYFFLFFQTHKSIWTIVLVSRWFDSLENSINIIFSVENIYRFFFSSTLCFFGNKFTINFFILFMRRISGSKPILIILSSNTVFIGYIFNIKSMQGLSIVFTLEIFAMIFQNTEILALHKKYLLWYPTRQKYCLYIGSIWNEMKQYRNICFTLEIFAIQWSNTEILALHRKYLQWKISVQKY